jgi:hypothetical protein
MRPREGDDLMRSVWNLLLLVCSSACTTLPAGRHYEMAKMNRDGSLIEARRQITSPVTTDIYDQIAPRESFGIKLNSGFIRYLESVERPEIAIFVNVLVREPTKADEGIVWQKVYLASEDKTAHMVLNKDTSLPRNDIYLLPPIAYEGQDITVELRVIELDQEDNERARQLVNMAASTAAVFQPEAAAAISVFQTVLTFLIANNADDIEFSYDFQISRDQGGYLRTADSGAAPGQFDISLMPRLGTYAILKSEHPTRANWPSDYLTVVGDGIRFGFAQILKFGTLGILNWPVFNPQEDRYLWLLGRPFGVAYDAWAVPEYDEKGRLIVSRHGRRSGLQTFDPDPARRRLVMVNQELFEVDVEGGNLPAGHHVHPFRGQSYLVLSFVSPEESVDYALLRAAFEQDEHLKELSKIRTTQLTTAEFADHVKRIGDSIQAVALEQQVVSRCKSLLRNAADDEALKKANEQCDADLKVLQDKTVVSPEVDTAFDNGVKARIDETKRRGTEKRKDQLALEKVGLDPTSVCLKRPSGELKLTCPSGTKLVVSYRKAEDPGIRTIPVVAPTACDAAGTTKTPVTFDAAAHAEPGPERHQLLVQIPERSNQKVLDFWVMDEGDTCPL